MCRCLGQACAAVLMLAAAGCLDSYLAPQIMVYGPKVVIPGTVDEVAAKLMDGLRETGILLHTKRETSSFRIVSEWKSHFVFCLLLSPQKGASGPSTLIRMKWDRGGNQELWQLILKILEAPDEEANAASANAAE
jgi:hypothetical protein